MNDPALPVYLTEVASEVLPDPAHALLNEALAGGNYWIAGAVAVVILVPLILKALGKRVPILDTVLAAALVILKGLSRPRAPPAPPPEPTEPEKQAQPGVRNLVRLRDISDLEKPK